MSELEGERRDLGADVNPAGTTPLGTSDGDEPPLPELSGAVVERLFKEQWASSVRLAIFLVGDLESAEEITQDAFVEVTRLGTELENPERYLRVVIANRCRNHRRHLAVVRRRPPPPPPMLVDAPELDEFWARLAGLTPRRRAAIVLRFYEDLSIDEIASLLDCRPSTVSSLLRRGLADLRKVLEDES